MSHIAVERKRRRQMNDHLKTLRSLTPTFYIKRGDQASIIDGAIEYIKELHLVLHSLEIQQQQRTSTTTTAAALSCKHTTHGPRWLNPSPTSAAASTNSRQPLPTTPVLRPSTMSLFTSPAPDIVIIPSASSAHNNSKNKVSFSVVSKEVGACSCISPVADVEAKISGANILLTTLTKRKPLGHQLINMITTLETLDFEVLHLNISTMDDTVFYSFIVKIGLDCLLSIEELVLEVQQSFCFDSAAY